MSVLPQSRQDQIAFCETHADVWQTNAAGLGVSVLTVTAMKTQMQAARNALIAAEQARDAAKAKTLSFYSATATMRDTAAGLIRAIKTFAESKPTQAERDAVYALAEFSPPAPPTPATAPGKPENISITLQPSGAVTVTWTAENAAVSSGAFFNVTRKLPGSAVGFVPFTTAAGTTSAGRTMSFTDATIPASAAADGVQYIIQGQRGLLAGEPSDVVLVQFGVDGTGGGFTLLNSGAKMAA